MLKGYDSSTPVANPPAWDVCLFYIGANNTTPHVWTDAEIAAQPVTYLDPTWVARLDAALDNAPSGQSDAVAACTWMDAHGAPKGSIVTLDTETLILPAYIAAFDAYCVERGYKCKNYGSLSYVVQNPIPSGGRHSADWRDIPVIDAGTGIVATQFADATQLGTGYDASLYDAGLSLMPKSALGGTPAPPSTDATEAIVNQLPLLVNGSTGQAVKNLQGLLLANGYSVGPSGMDGKDGPDTTAAVVAFQKAHGLEEDGEVGTGQTWPALLGV